MTLVSLSEKSQVIAQLHKELEQLEALQLKVGENMSALLFEQVRLAEKTRAIMNTMERVMSL